jgi:hypothetical protein
MPVLGVIVFVLISGCLCTGDKSETKTTQTTMVSSGHQGPASTVTQCYKPTVKRCPEITFVRGGIDQRGIICRAVATNNQTMCADITYEKFYENMDGPAWSENIYQKLRPKEDKAADIAGFDSQREDCIAKVAKYGGCPQKDTYYWTVEGPVGT